MVGSPSSKDNQQEHVPQHEETLEHHSGQAQPSMVSHTKLWRPGTIIAGSYKILGCLGEGSSGLVYKVLHLETKHLRALKIPPPHMLGDLAARETFIRETKVAAKLQHEHLITIRQVACLPDSHQVFFTMDLMEGGDLGKILGQAILANQPLDAYQVLNWMFQIAQALAYIHDQGLIHQDIKPGNIMLDHTSKACLGDFGLAFKYGEASARIQLAQSTVIGGTTYFLSPEQHQAIFYQKKIDITQASDVFSFGLTLYNLLSGEIIAGSREPIIEFVKDPDLAGAIDVFLERCLARKPEKRFSSGQEMLFEYRQIMTFVPKPREKSSRPQVINRAKSRLWKSSLEPGVRRTIRIAKQCEMSFVWIPPSAFQMGTDIHCESRFEDEGPVSVELSQGFWMAERPVSQGQWKVVMGTQPSFRKGKHHPVEMITWYEVQAFVDACNRQQNSATMMLPSEAQWECACRCGGREGLPSKLTEVAWFDENSKGKTHRLGILQANAWGLHDMLGNVWEWCSDYYDAYPQQSVIDPCGPRQGTHRVLRGGSFDYGAKYCRPQTRFRYLPDNKNLNIGFRIVATMNA